jgi:hypothetical protein
VASLIRPGEGAAARHRRAARDGHAADALRAAGRHHPANIFEALAKGDMLAIIFVAILLGVGTLLAGEAGRPFANLLQSVTAVLLKIVGIVMEATPFGVFALIANAVAANGAAVFVNVGWLALAVVLGSAIQILLVHSLLLRFLARVPVLRFYRGIVDALAVAFSTASSSATLPVAMRVAEKNLGVGRPVYSTVLPLGASIGKDGTAMYVGLLSLFSLQALGVPMTPPSTPGPADRRAGRLRDRAGPVRIAVHAGRRALLGRRRARADRAGGRLRAAVRPAARHDPDRAERQRQPHRGHHRRALGRRARRRCAPVAARTRGAPATGRLAPPTE